MRIKALFFDFGGTLDADGIPWKDRFFALIRAEGHTDDREAFYRAYYDADDPLVEADLEGISYHETVHRLARGIFSRLKVVDTAAPARIAERFLEEAKKKIQENLKILAPLKEKYCLGIISNTYGNLDRTVHETGLDHLFDVAIDSVRVASSKPEPAIFQSALDAAEVLSGEAIMIGDSMPRDMRGAKALGMRHIWLARRDIAAPVPCCPGDRVIRSLSELPEVLP